MKNLLWFVIIYRKSFGLLFPMSFAGCDIKKSSAIVIGLVLILLISPLQAAFELELTQGVDRRQPLAVMSFVDERPNHPLTQVIAQDLENSGYFNVSDYANDAVNSDPEQVNYNLWQQRGFDHLVIGSIEKQTDGNYRIEYSLLDVFKGVLMANATDDTAHLFQSQTPVLRSQYFIVPEQQFRSLAHHISDAVYEAIMGEKGIFSTKIAYVRVEYSRSGKPEYSLEVADYDGKNPQALLESPQPIISPRWSPDGKQLAYVSFEDRRPAIFIADVQTGERRLISAMPGINGAPSWSPDGQRLAIVLSKEKNPNIYEFELASGNLKQITYGADINTEPVWSKDGKRLLFTSDRQGAPQIFELTVGTDRIIRVSKQRNYTASASYTPDGQRLVMVQQVDGNFEVVSQSLNSSAVNVLTSVKSARSPSIAADGHKIVYSFKENGLGILGIVSLDGRVQLRIIPERGHLQEPAWSPYMNR